MKFYFNLTSHIEVDKKHNLRESGCQNQKIHRIYSCKGLRTRNVLSALQFSLFFAALDIQAVG